MLLPAILPTACSMLGSRGEASDGSLCTNVSSTTMLSDMISSSYCSSIRPHSTQRSITVSSLLKRALPELSIFLLLELLLLNWSLCCVNSSRLPFLHTMMRRHEQTRTGQGLLVCFCSSLMHYSTRLCSLNEKGLFCVILITSNLTLRNDIRFCIGTQLHFVRDWFKGISNQTYANKLHSL